MANKPKKNVPRREVPVGDVDPATGEDKRGEAATVGWMLAMMATTAADVLSAFAGVIMPAVARRAEEPGLAMALPQLLLFVAAMTGIVCVMLTPVVYKFRRTPPPVQITAFGIVVSVLPVLALGWRAISG
jgi:hypothetical protein